MRCRRSSINRVYGFISTFFSALLYCRTGAGLKEAILHQGGIQNTVNHQLAAAFSPKMIDVQAVQNAHRAGVRQLLRQTTESNGIDRFMTIQRPQDHLEMCAANNTRIDHLETALEQWFRKVLAPGAETDTCGGTRTERSFPSACDPQQRWCSGRSSSSHRRCSTPGPSSGRFCSRSVSASPCTSTHSTRVSRSERLHPPSRSTVGKEGLHPTDVLTSTGGRPLRHLVPILQQPHLFE